MEVKKTFSGSKKSFGVIGTLTIYPLVGNHPHWSEGQQGWGGVHLRREVII